MSTRRITERRAALAARQLLLHERKMAWMKQKMRHNQEVLDSYLVLRGQKTARAAEYVVWDAGEEVKAAEVQRDDGFEQLELEVG